MSEGIGELITGCSDSENGEWNFDLLTFSMKSKRIEKKIQNDEPANDESSVEVKIPKLSQNNNYRWEVDDFYFQVKSTIAINWICNNRENCIKFLQTQ